MPDTIPSSTAIDEQIADLERSLHERLQGILARLQRGEDGREGEAGIRDMRSRLDLLRAQRRQHVRSMHVQTRHTFDLERRVN